jgi:hypothetical protein
MPIRWTRVHNLADYVYFDHSIHVNKGISCTKSHGNVESMPIVWKEATPQMGWCLEVIAILPRRAWPEMLATRTGDPVPAPEAAIVGSTCQGKAA